MEKANGNGNTNGSTTATKIEIDAPADDPSHIVHKVRSEICDIDGIPTTFILQPYSDRVFIIVTQSDKLGTILSAGFDVTLAGAESYHVQTLMGKRDVPELELCARQVIQAMKTAGCNKPLLLSLALKSHDLPTMHAIIAKIKDIPVW